MQLIKASRSSTTTRFSDQLRPSSSEVFAQIRAYPSSVYAACLRLDSWGRSSKLIRSVSRNWDHRKRILPSISRSIVPSLCLGDSAEDPTRIVFSILMPEIDQLAGSAACHEPQSTGSTLAQALAASPQQAGPPCLQERHPWDRGRPARFNKGSYENADEPPASPGSYLS